MPEKYQEEESKRISRSTKLRKYASVYKSYVRKTEQSKTDKSPRRPRNKTQNQTRNYEDKKPDVHKSKKSTNKKVSKSKRKTLNEYQKFVKSESKKDKYKDFPGKERLSCIATEWKKINKNKY